MDHANAKWRLEFRLLARSPNFTPPGRKLMASSEVQQPFPTNGHVHPTDVEHEDTTGCSPVEPPDRPVQDIPEIGLEDAGTAQHEQPRSAQPEEIATSPVLDNPPTVPSAVSSKHKLATSPTKRPTPTVQTTTTKGASAPPTPQVKKVFTHFFNPGRGCCSF